MFDEKFKIALGEFWHVGSVLVIVIAGIAILTGFVREYIPQEKFQKKLKNQNTVMGAFMGAALGILTPFCSASMVPVAMGMIEKSAPFSTVLPFLISAPLANFVVVGIIFGTFGIKVATIYFVWVFGGAIVAGLTVGRNKWVQKQVKNLAEVAEAKKKANNTGFSASTNKNASACCSIPITTCCSDITSNNLSNSCCETA